MNSVVEQKLRRVWSSEEVESLIKLLGRGFSPNAVRILEVIFVNAAEQTKSFSDLSAVLNCIWERIWSEQRLGIRGDFAASDWRSRQSSKTAIAYLCEILGLRVPEEVVVEG